MTMNSRFIRTVCIASLLFIYPVLVQGEDQNVIKLPDPQTDIGKPLMQVLKERESSRSFSEKKLPDQVLSNLLWAAAGINRKDSGKRTAPSAVNWQEVEVYVATAEGLYLYDAKAHALNPILSEDIRAATGSQGFVKDVPVNLIYVADFSEITRGDEAVKVFYSAADTGFISQNVYLFCAAFGLGTVVRDWIDRPTLSKKISLREEQKIILAQTVGYPK
jgi:SagB-type dehydrogenase family enzyme